MAQAKQGSDEWFEARRHRLTGSNVGAALGLNPWKKPEDVIRDMVRDYHGYERDFKSNVATEYGSLHEPLAAMEYFTKTGNLVEECGFFVHPEHAWLGASPDGLVGDDGLVEIKCPFSLRNSASPEFKILAEQPHYKSQVMVELACTGRNYAHFYQWSKNGDSLEIVNFDPKWWDQYFPEMEAFYNRYLSELDNPDHLEDKQKEINTFKAKKLIEEWDTLKATIDDAEARRKEVLAELVRISGERDALMHGRKLTKVERKGAVNYNSIPELEGVDLEQYRNASSKYWRLS